MKTFLENHKLVRAADSATAATTNVTSDVVPMAGYERCTFVAMLGTVVAGGTASMSLYVGDDSSGTLNSEIEDTKVESTVSDSMMALEFFRPDGQYVHVVVKRADENIEVDGIVCILSDPKEAPVTKDDSLADSESLTYSQL